MKKIIRVVVVDDSVFMRKVISKILNSHSNIEVVATANNGKEAVEKNITLKPDAITMDVEMPVMNGILALEAIMKSRPVPILMLSSVTSDGANATLDALAKGAIGFITKKSAFNEMSSLKDEIINEILNISTNSAIRNQIQRRKALNSQKKLNDNPILNENSKIGIEANKTIQTQSSFGHFRTNKISDRIRPTKTDISIIVIGISTGGPAALLNVIPQLPSNLPVPIVIAQHMPPHFTKSLSDRLDSKSEVKVKEAEDGEILKKGTVYIAKGGSHLKITKRSKLLISSEPINELYKPCINVLIDSVVDVFHKKTLGIIMTGMGHDGYEGIKRLREKGGYAIAQSIESSIASGMPETLISKNETDEIYDLDKIPGAIASFFN